MEGRRDGEGIDGPRRAIGRSGQGANGIVAGVAGAGEQEGAIQGGNGQAEHGSHPAGQTPNLHSVVGEGDGAERGRQGDDGVGPGLTCGGGARRETGHSPAPGHACHGTPVAGHFQHQWGYGIGRVGRVLTPLENRASLSNIEGVVSSQGFVSKAIRCVIERAGEFCASTPKRRNASFRRRADDGSL